MDGESKFNSGIAQLDRIDIQKRKLHEAREKNKWSKFYKALQSIRAEVWEWLNPDERTETKNYESQLDNEFCYNEKKGIDINKLKDFENYLNDKLHKYKLSMPAKDDFQEPENF